MDAMIQSCSKNDIFEAIHWIHFKFEGKSTMIVYKVILYTHIPIIYICTLYINRKTYQHTCATIQSIAQLAISLKATQINCMQKSKINQTRANNQSAREEVREKRN